MDLMDQVPTYGVLYNVGGTVFRNFNRKRLEKFVGKSTIFCYGIIWFNKISKTPVVLAFDRADPKMTLLYLGKVLYHYGGLFSLGSTGTD